MSGAEVTSQGPGRSHRLPATRSVDRHRFLRSISTGRRVIHVGFAASTARDEREPHGLWVHGALAGVAERLVGIDIDEAAVDRARAEGYEVHLADCTSPAAVRGLALERAELVVASEVIEHVDAPGGLLEAMHELVEPGGRLVITTPNASSVLHPLAALAGREVVHPDHIALYSWYTLTNLLGRHGWRVADFLTYDQPFVQSTPGAPASRAVLVASTNLILGVQRLLARRRPFVANGLIAVCLEE